MKIKSLLFALLIMGFINNSFATHLAGGQVTAEYIGGSKYIVTVKVFRDCAGIPQSTDSAQVFYDDCLGSHNIPLPFIDSNEVSQLCAIQIGQSQCNGGILPGMQEYIYCDTVSVDLSCGTLTNIIFAWNDGARNDAISNIANAGSYNIFIPCIVYVGQDSTNSTPQFFSPPIPYFCAGQYAVISLGAFDTDGDSLVYELGQPLQANGVIVSYISPYTILNPFPTSTGISINHQTGLLSFTPSNIGLFAFVILCKEYDRNTGMLISETRRDLQTYIRSCTNQAPTSSYTIAKDTTQVFTWNITPVYPQNFTGARWYWGDGTSTVAPYPSHTYAVAGNYNICVTAYTSCGDSSSFCNNDSIYRTENIGSVINVNVLNNNIVTKINEYVKSENAFHIYPNPNNGSMQISYNIAPNQKAIFNLYDVTGRKSLSKVLNSDASLLQFNETNLSEGIYIYQFMMDSKIVKTGKLVIVN